MEAQDFSDHDASSQRQRADLHDLEQLGFHVDAGFLDARRLHQVARDRSQSRLLELIDLWRKFRRADVHPLGNILGHHIHHKFPGRLNVADRILSGPVAEPDHGAEQYRRRIGAHAGEEAEGRKIADPVEVHGGDKRDGARDNGPD